MSRFLPSSLLGQVMASVAVALLIAQIVSATLLYRAGEDRRESAMLTGVAFLLVNGPDLTARAGDDRRPPRIRDRDRSGSPSGLPRRLRYRVSEAAPITYPETEGETAREERLRALLAQEGITPFALEIAYRRAGEDEVVTGFAQERPRFAARDEWKNRRMIVAAIQREQNGVWETARLILPRNPQGGIGVLLFQTLVIFVSLMAILYVVLRRITRPLAALTERVGDFSKRPDQAVMLEESGPSDTRRLIAAHNAMEARIALLLDEKDVMLGAIGHDLKTPLAALRVRIESVEDDTHRGRMADSIEDITATLDDILTLARVGRAEEAPEAVDLGALAVSVVEEFEDLGQPATISDPPRVVANVQVTWLKRALRNLVTNAIRYGEEASLSVSSDGENAILSVDDKGPGIPEDRIAGMLEPFARGEGSRNRATGGAGLGLTLARAIAEQHGGELVLTNRSEGGLRAELRVPIARRQSA